MNIIYIAIVLDPELLEQTNVKHSNKYCHHITLAYGGITELPSFLGRRVSVTLQDYYADDKGEAMSAMVSDKEVADYAEQHKQKLHLTLSCAAGTGPRYSNELIANTEPLMNVASNVSGTVQAFCSDYGTSFWLENYTEKNNE